MTCKKESVRRSPKQTFVKLDHYLGRRSHSQTANIPPHEEARHVTSRNAKLVHPGTAPNPSHRASQNRMHSS